MGDHTPGTWEAGTDEDGGLIFAWANGKCRVVANTDDQHENIPPEEFEANARLIAAAPDLLAACKQVKKYLDGMGLDWLGNDDDPLESAIAKADGKNGPVNP